MMNLNLRGVYFCIKYGVPALQTAKGSIVNIASILGVGGRGAGCRSIARKVEVINMTRDLAIEFRPR